MSRHAHTYRLLPVLALFALLLFLSSLPARLARATHSPLATPPSPVLIDAVYDPVPGSGGQPVHVRNPGPLAPAAEPNPSRMPQTSGLTPRVDLDTLILVYTNTAMGSITSGDLERLQDEIDTTTTFLWRHSHLKLHLNRDYIIIEDYKDITEFTETSPGVYWLYPDDGDQDGESVENDLVARGVEPDRYDSINYFWAHNGEYGMSYGGLGGLIYWSLGLHGITEQPITKAFCGGEGGTAFPHEIQHTIDGLLEWSGYEDYFFADRPWDLPGAFGEDWDFWVSGMERWPIDHWFVLNEPWGTIVNAADNDDDGVPDEALDGLTTEELMGSSPLKPDTDDDQLLDLGEAMAGIYQGSDATGFDTDADGLADGDDHYPLYGVTTQILSKTLSFDGDPSGWDILTTALFEQNAPLSVTVAANWDSDYLYLMVIEDRYAGIHIQIDANNDGWFHGRDNYQLSVDPSYPNPTDPWIIGSAHIWDSSEELIAQTGVPMWDDDPSYPYDPGLTREDILRYARPYGSGFLVQLGIPVNQDTGMTPSPLEQVGVLVKFDYLDRQPYTFASLWEKTAWVRMTYRERVMIYLPLVVR